MILKQSAIVYPAAATITSNELDGYSYPSSTTISCQVTPISAASAFEQFGVELTDGFLLITTAANASLFAYVGTRVTVGEVEYRSKAHAMTYSGIGAADHTSVVIGRVQ